MILQHRCIKSNREPSAVRVLSVVVVTKNIYTIASNTLLFIYATPYV
jgi:hypothetical protein